MMLSFYFVCSSLETVGRLLKLKKLSLVLFQQLKKGFGKVIASSQLLAKTDTSGIFRIFFLIEQETDKQEKVRGKMKKITLHFKGPKNAFLSLKEK